MRNLICFTSSMPDFLNSGYKFIPEIDLRDRTVDTYHQFYSALIRQVKSPIDHLIIVLSIINQNRRQMYSKINSKARTLDNIDFLVSIGDFKLRLSLPKNTTVAGLITIVKGYEALHQEYGPQGQSFLGLGSPNCNPFLDYWLTQGTLDFMRFRRKIQVKALYSCERRSEKIGIAQLQFLVCLGKGACGEVYLVRSRVSGCILALKRVRKETITTYNSLMTQFRERKSMIQLSSNPYTVTLHAAFESVNHFNFLLDYCPGGELFLHLTSKNHKLNLHEVKHYFCQILLGMQYIHKKKVLYRDLKPENIFVDINGHLKIGDFGLSKCNFEEDDTAFSVCGSAQYMAPQVLQNKDYNFSADFYSIGALLYELLTGFPPYYGEGNQKQKLKLMKNMDLEFDRITDDPLLRQLLINLLHPDPDQRISNFQEIKNSAWLSKVDWKTIEARNDVLPFAPDPSGVYIGKQFLDLQPEVDEMNYQYEEDSFSSEISDTFEYIRPESKKLLGLDTDNLPSNKVLKPKMMPRVEKKHSKKTNLSVALFDKDTPTDSGSNTQARTSKHTEINKENKQNKENLIFKADSSRKGLIKQPSHILLLGNKGTISTHSINLASQKSQRSLIINSHNSSECSIKTSKASSRAKDIQPRGEVSRSKGTSKQKGFKNSSLSKVMKKKEEKKTILPTCSFKIKLT